MTCPALIRSGRLPIFAGQHQDTRLTRTTMPDPLRSLRFCRPKPRNEEEGRDRSPALPQLRPVACQRPCGDAAGGAGGSSWDCYLWVRTTMMTQTTDTKAKGCQIGTRSHQSWSFCIRALLTTKNVVAADRFLNGLACPTVLRAAP